MLSPNACANYLKLGSSTRRYSVIGCIGFENANPHHSCVETAEIGVGTSTCHDGDNEGNACAICLESFVSGSGSGSGSGCAPQKNVATTECGHTFCLSCLLKHLRISNTCPLCRAPVEQNVKQVFKPLSYSEGIGLLDHELNGLRIVEDVEQFVQNAIEISSQPNTNGQNVEDVVGEIMNMVTNFGFNLLYDATLHTTGSEEHMDPDWIVQMYHNDSTDNNSDSDSDSADDSTLDDESDSDSDSDDSTLDDESESESSESNDDGNGNESENKRIVLPEVPESML
jgi:hypothetical protein